MSARLVAVTFDVVDAAATARFWAGLLGRDVVDHADGLLVPGDSTRVGLRFVSAPAPQDEENRMHLHVTSNESGDQQVIIDQAVALGAVRVDVGQLPEEDHVVLSDPGGDPFCVIEPRNSYLAGTGLLGEVACDGSRHVGVFWSEVLGWPLVWDQDEETAIQSPAGGTKVAWGGPPDVPLTSRARQRFDLAVASADLDAEVTRLIGLGAAPVSTDAWGTSLADPEGTEFRLSPA